LRAVSPLLACRFLRRRLKPRLNEARTLTEAARAFALDLPYEAPQGGFKRRRLGGVPTEICGAGTPLLYLHGGAFFAGTPKSYRPIAAAFAAMGFQVFTPAYRLAPRHVFPAAFEDARAALTALAEERGSVMLAGDSAGAGLAIGVMAARRRDGESLPAAAALFSPWTDLAVTGASARANEERDPLFTRKMLKIASRAYLAGASPRDPRASPLYAEPSGLPPLLIHVAEDELLRDDALRFAARARQAGVETKLSLWPEVPHCWQLAVGVMAEARASLREAAAFLRQRAA
jgi:epsilon-lactone hydrolase